MQHLTDNALHRIDAYADEQSVVTDARFDVADLFEVRPDVPRVGRWAACWTR